MSGYKYSHYRIEMNRERRMEMNAKINDEQTKLKNIVKRIKKELKEVPEGLKNTFSSLTAEVRDWLDRADNRKLAIVNEDGDVPYLQNTMNRFTKLREEGEKLLEKMIESFTVRADKLEKQLLVQLTRIESDYQGNLEKLENWAGEETEKIVSWIKRIETEIDGKDYARAERTIVEARMMLDNTVKKADELEMKHQKRLYLLKALRQVCSEMGFEETRAPEYENETDKTKPIEFEVDTLDQGKITFHLSLDGIRTFSEIMDGKCISEFDQLSEYLEEEFGVKTKFIREDEKPDDILIAKGELEIPGEDSVMYMEKQ